MDHQKIRVRFAPAPTGMMHLGNVRTALMNFLFSHRKGGTFILRIEDTDMQRNYDPQATGIMKDLQWLDIHHDEGASIGGDYGPYFQSQRDAIYQEQLKVLQNKNLAYRCFCSTEELERKRQRQLALKQPPRYDRTCLHLSASVLQENLQNKMPFVWRFKVDEHTSYEIHDMARGIIHFDMKNFWDFPLTRADGTVTFMFANFVDDMLMKITHVIRGEDHLTNTAGQAALYHAFAVPLPIFWHLPILCNAQGKKLSKRDFGFSLNDLRNTGFLPEAIDNYLAIIGGGNFEHEIMDMQAVIKAINFDKIESTGHVRYDVEKLRWMNHKWIDKLSAQDIANRAVPFIAAKYSDVSKLNKDILIKMVSALKSDMHILTQAPDIFGFYFERPTDIGEKITACITRENAQKLVTLIQSHLAKIAQPADFISDLKQALGKALPTAQLYWFIRIALMGKKDGPSLADIIQILGPQESKERITAACKEVIT